MEFQHHAKLKKATNGSGYYDHNGSPPCSACEGTGKERYIATGKGNPDWNYSGPHGAGRVLSRTKAKEQVDFADFQDTMQDVWTTSVSPSTLDESPMAYKSLDMIMDNIQQSLDIQQVIKPLYNFKSCGDGLSAVKEIGIYYCRKG